MSFHKNAVVVIPPVPKHNKSIYSTTAKFLNVIAPFYSSVSLIGSNCSKNNFFLERDVSPKITVCDLEINKEERIYRKIVAFQNFQDRAFKHIISSFVATDCVVFFWLTGNMGNLISKVSKSQFETWTFCGGDPSLGIEGKQIPSLIKKIAKFYISYSYRLALKKSNHLFVESESVIKTNPFLRNYQKNIHKIHLYVDDRFLQNVIPSQKMKNLIFIGRLSKEKGVFQLLEAFSDIVLLAQNAIELYFVGTGPDELELGKISKDLGLENKVIFTGWKSLSEVINMLNSSRYLILPSKTEGLPNVVIESMASGTPVIATPVGGIIDLIEDQVNGFIIPQNDSQTIAQILLKSLNISERSYQKMCLAARERAKQFSLKSARENFEKVLQGTRGPLI